MKRHATDDVDPIMVTLCGLDATIDKVVVGEYVRFGKPPLFIDNANPDCKRCLRVIAARLAKCSA